MWRLQTSGRAHRATRRGPAADPPPLAAAALPLLPLLSLGKKVSAVEGLAQTGVRPDTISLRKAACPGCSEAKETVVDASTYICTEDDTVQQHVQPVVRRHTQLINNNKSSTHPLARAYAHTRYSSSCGERTHAMKYKKHVGLIIISFPFDRGCIYTSNGSMYLFD